MKEETKKWIGQILLALLIVACVASLSMLVSDTRTEWYEQLNKPSFQPPAAVFPVAWSIIYLLYAASLTLILKNGASTKSVVFFALQGVFNILWPLLFFTLKTPSGAFVALLLYLAACLLTVLSLWKDNKVAAILQLPILAWLIFAAVLNYTTVFLN